MRSPRPDAGGLPALPSQAGTNSLKPSAPDSPLPDRETYRLSILCLKDSYPKETFKMRQFYRNLNILFIITIIIFIILLLSSKCAVFSSLLQIIVLKQGP